MNFLELSLLNTWYLMGMLYGHAWKLILCWNVDDI